MNFVHSVIANFLILQGHLKGQLLVSVIFVSQGCMFLTHVTIPRNVSLPAISHMLASYITKAITDYKSQ